MAPLRDASEMLVFSGRHVGGCAFACMVGLPYSSVPYQHYPVCSRFCRVSEAADGSARPKTAKAAGGKGRALNRGQMNYHMTKGFRDLTSHRLKGGIAQDIDAMEAKYKAQVRS